MKAYEIVILIVFFTFLGGCIGYGLNVLLNNNKNAEKEVPKDVTTYYMEKDAEIGTLIFENGSYIYVGSRKGDSIGGTSVIIYK